MLCDEKENHGKGCVPQMVFSLELLQKLVDRKGRNIVWYGFSAGWTELLPNSGREPAVAS
jgi:hypothetical protein